MDIHIGNRSIVPLREAKEPEYFGPVEFQLRIASDEETILNQTIPFTNLLKENKID